MNELQKKWRKALENPNSKYLKSEDSQSSLLVFGAGDLATRVIENWKTLHPNAPIRIVTQTQSKWKRFPQLEKALFDSVPSHWLSEAHFIATFVPPSSFDEEQWNQLFATSSHSAALKAMITSTGVYAEDQGQTIDESSSLKPTDQSPVARQDVWAQKMGFHCFRVAGLYSATKGPHQIYLKRGSIPLPKDAWINLIHYQDAADTIAVLLHSQGLPPTLNVSDREPITRESLCTLLSKRQSDLRWGPPSAKGLGKKVTSRYDQPDLTFGSFLQFLNETPYG